MIRTLDRLLPAAALGLALASAAAAARAQDRVAVILTPRREAVLCAEVPGRAVAVNRELGQRFEKDEVLIQLDDLTYRVSREMAEARLRAAENDLQQVRKLTTEQTRLRHAQAVLKAAQTNLAATQRLYDNGHASESSLRMPAATRPPRLRIASSWRRSPPRS